MDLFDKGSIVPPPININTVSKTESTSENPEQCLYMFGLNSKNDTDRRIAKFNFETNKFQIIKAPGNMTILNAMGVLWVSSNQIYLTGGVNSEFNSISNQFEVYDATNNTCEVLPHFCMERFGHDLVFLNNKLYIIGGKQYGKAKDTVLSHCEYYDFNTKQWKKMAQMLEQRVTFILFVYQNTIWVMGGCGYGGFRSQVIEKYNMQYDYWERIDVDLNRGIEFGYAISTKPNEIITIGGKINSGNTSTCHKYDLFHKTVVCTDWMQKPRVLQKANFYQNQIFCLGGDEEETIEKGLIAENEIIWEVQNADMKPYVKKEQCVNFSYSQRTLVIQSEDVPENLEQYQYNGQRAFFFGNDEDPFIMEIRFQEQKIIKRPVPLQLELVAFQAGVKLNENEYFLSSGIKENKTQISRKTYIFNVSTNKVKRLKNSIIDKYGPNAAYIHPYIYLVGGRQYGDDNQALLKNCERYNLDTDQWMSIDSFSEFICSPNVIVYKQQLYVFGGYIGKDHRSDAIQRYNEQINKWEILSSKIHVPNEAFGIIYNPNQQHMLIFGGITQDYDSDQVEYYEIPVDMEGIKYNESKSGHVQSARILPKVYQINDEKVLLMGGSNGLQNGFCEVYDVNLKAKKNDGYETLLQDLNALVDKSVGDIHLKQYLLL